jgi:serine/threonine protein kinase
MSTNLRRLGKYELRERLGRGGMAEVWKAFDPQLKRFVAIKILHADLQADPSFVARFEREAQAIASLHHPNIVQIYDFNVTPPSEAESTAYMVMNYVEGQTLASFIHHTSRAGKFPSPATLVELFTPISLAIDYAHQKGMIHRDIKPANILLDERNTSHLPIGEPILSDFGIAKLLGGSTGTLSRWWLGTPHYTAPELVMGAPGNERSDIYSLGIILYEVCTGVLPFQGRTPTEIMMQHINTAPTPPLLINPAIPPALTAVILRALAKDAAARFPTASTMVAALAEAFNMPVPKALNIPSNSSEVMYSPTHVSPLSPHLLPREAISSGALPPAPASNPPSPPAPQLAAPADSGQHVSRGAPGETPNVPVLSQSSAQLPALASSPPSADTMPPKLTIPLLKPSPPAQPSPPVAGKRKRWALIGLVIALVLVVLSSGLAAFFLLPRDRGGSTHQSTTRPLVGYAFFISSGQIGETSNQGITDELEIQLSNIPDPRPGKSYYGWLEPDILQTTTRAPVLLGTLPVTNGKMVYLYRGDARHTNLLATMSRFLITEEDTAVQPHIPSPDTSTWRYAAQFPQATGSMNAPQNTPSSSMRSPQSTPAGMSGMENLTVLDHLRHLLAQAPELQAIGLAGGLDIWLYRNTEKILEWSVSARDDWQTQSFPLLHRHIVRILDYLDGLSFVQQDAPGEPVYVIPADGKIGLLDVDPSMMAHGFLYTVDEHLNALIQSPGATPDQRRLAAQVDNAVKNVETWLTNVRKNALQLERMSSAQLAQTTTRDNLLDTMADDASSAFAGRIDPDNGDVQGGAIQIHYDIQRLATFDVERSPS